MRRALLLLLSLPLLLPALCLLPGCGGSDDELVIYTSIYPRGLIA